MQVIILIGPPLAGKGTQSDLLIADGYAHLSAGQYLRERAEIDDEEGRAIARTLRLGELVPDETVNEVVADALRRQQMDGVKGVVLDGYPRTLGQARFLDETLRRENLRPKVIELLVEDESILDLRRQKRLRDAFAAQAAPRADDQPDIFRRRMAVYHAQSALLGPHYAVQGVLHWLDGLAGAAKVYDEVSRILRKDVAASGSPQPNPLEDFRLT